MKIFSISNNKYITPKTTGYASATGIALTLLSGITKNKSFRKSHKPLAYLSTGLTALHIGLIEYNYYNWKKTNK